MLKLGLFGVVFGAIFRVWEGLTNHEWHTSRGRDLGGVGSGLRKFGLRGSKFWLVRGNLRRCVGLKQSPDHVYNIFQFWVFLGLQHGFRGFLAGQMLFSHYTAFHSGYWGAGR